MIESGPKSYDHGAMSQPTVGVVLSTLAQRVAGAKRTIESLLAQNVDSMHVVRVGRSGERLPEDPRVSYEWAPDGQGPAYRMRTLPETDVVCSVDDDIFYPPDYVEQILKTLTTYGREVAVSYHCSYWPRQRTGYGVHRRCVQYQHGETVLYAYPLGGAGVMSFWRETFHTSEQDMRDFEYENDTLFSAILRAARVRILRPPSKPNWLCPNTSLPRGSLWEAAIADRYNKKNAAIREAERRFGFKLTDRVRYP